MTCRVPAAKSVSRPWAAPPSRTIERRARAGGFVHFGVMDRTASVGEEADAAVLWLAAAVLCGAGDPGVAGYP